METSLTVLEKTINDVDEAILIIDKNTFEILYANKKAKETFCSELDNHIKCYEMNTGINEQCSFCPLRNVEQKEVYLTSNQKIYALKTKQDQIDDQDIIIEYIKDVTQEKNAKKIYKKQVKAILSRYQDASLVLYVNLTQDKIYSIDGRKDVVKVCDTGLSFDQNINKIVNRITDKRDKKKFSKIFSREALLDSCVQGNTVLQYDVKIIQNDGLSHLTLIGANLLIEPVHGDTEGIIYTRNIQDIFLEEDRLHREIKEQKESLTKTENIISTAGIGTWEITLFDQEEPKMYADDTMKQLLAIEDDNLSPEETYLAWFNHIDESEVSRVLACVDTIRNGEQSEVTYLWNHPTLGKVYVRCGGRCEKVPNKGDKLSGYHCYIYEIVEAELKHQTELKENLQVISAMCDNYAVVYYIDLDHNIFNSFAENEEYQIYANLLKNKHDYDELIEEMVDHCIEENRKEKVKTKFSREEILKNLNENDRYAFRIKTSRKIKKHHNFEVKIVSCFDDGSHHCVMGIQCIDKMLEEELENQNQLEKALQEAKSADEAKSMFLARMSHDIRTPINGLKGMISIAKEEMDNPEKARNDLDKALNAEKLLESLLNDVLFMSKMEANKLQMVYENINIKNILLESIELQQDASKNKNLVINHEIEITHENVNTCSVALSRILLNILSNAIKYNKENEPIDVSLKEEIIDENNSSYIFKVSDHGVGMTEEFVNKHLFEPFVQEKQDARTYYSGIGLGMSITKELVDKMHGKIEVESQKDVGSTFIITLPMELKQVEEKEKEYTKKLINLQNKKILIVEDNELNMEICKYFLENVKATVMLAKDGKEALDKFIASPIGDIHLILMDIMMPNMNGYEATSAIRKLDRADAKTVPIVAMTANAFEEDKKKAKEVGMNEYVAKPIDENLLIDKLEEILIKGNVKPLTLKKERKNRKKLKKVVD